MKVVALIQARMGSSRLPGKVIADICGHPLIWHIADRLGHSRMLGGVMIATSEGSDCDPIREVASRYGLECFSGPEENLLERLHGAASSAGADAFVRVTADNPLVDPFLVDRMVRTFVESGPVDCVVNYLPRTFPHGLDLEVYATALLRRLAAEVPTDHDREWFSTYVIEHTDRIKVGRVTQQPDLSALRWTVDYPEDLEFSRAVFSALWRPGQVFGMQDILTLITKHPELAAINAKHSHPPVPQPTETSR